ncbi:SOMATIC EMBRYOGENESIS RECEPTOR KINASE 1 [Salix koriyanagi]|uniref:SOMATIC EMBRYOGENESIS RECEPTOR KINASE 1 n=1 Tax=Salix koriyanagi TaxID=2511006 RepID=A0A9Q1AH48_9ROSI|nr:SOMATIC EMBRYOGENESIS RECEPTOR KINASE 1 [Salix koriyanagi]
MALGVGGEAGFEKKRVVGVLHTLMEISTATLSPAGINYEVVALVAIKTALRDPYNVLDNWDINSVDPCSWRMVTCSSDGYVSALGLPSQSLSGTLSPSIGNLTNLQSVLLQNNAISGPIPAAIGKLEKLHTLDLSNNTFSGEMPTSLGNLKNLNYLRLNNNSLTGPCPESLSKLNGLTLVDLSFNNLSGSLPKILARTFKVTGNPLICGPKASDNCSAVFPEPSFSPAQWSIRLWNKQSSRGYCFWGKLWCCLFHHNSYWFACLVAI